MVKTDLIILIGFACMFVAGLVLGLVAQDPLGFLKDLGI